MNKAFTSRAFISKLSTSNRETNKAEKPMNHEKMEAIKQLTLAAIVIAIIFGLLHYLNKPERVRLAKVQSGELVLECNMKRTGLTIIDPEKVTGHSDVTWWFINGVSSRCTTKTSNKGN